MSRPRSRHSTEDAGLADTRRARFYTLEVRCADQRARRRAKSMLLTMMRGFRTVLLQDPNLRKPDGTVDMDRYFCSPALNMTPAAYETSCAATLPSGRCCSRAGMLAPGRR